MTKKLREKKKTSKEMLEKDFERRYVSKEFCELIDKHKEKINDFARNSFKRVGDITATRDMARKYKEAGLDK